MKISSFPSINEIEITTGERSWTFNRSMFSLISQKLYTLNDTSFFSQNLPNRSIEQQVSDITSEKTNLNNRNTIFTIKIPDDYSTASVDSIIKFIYTIKFPILQNIPQ